MLLRAAPVGGRDPGRQHQAVVLHAAGFTQLLIAPDPSILPRVSCASTATVHDDVGDRYALRAILRVQGLPYMRRPPMVAVGIC